jgi:hypothetical protein
MRLVFAAIFVLIFSFTAYAADYSAVTSGDAVLRAAPADSATKLGVVPSGTKLVVNVCFGEGAFCAVTGSGVQGFIAGPRLLIDGTDQTIAAAEAAKWALLRSTPSPWTYDPKTVALRDVRTEGDSYMRGACNISITPELKAALNRSVVSTALGGSEMGAVRDRTLAPANKALLPYITVFWDGSQNGMTTVAEYADLLGQAIAALGHDHFVVIPAGVPAGVTDQTQTTAIQREFKRRWPDNFLDWREILPTKNGAINADQQCDAVHLNAKGLQAMAKGIASFITAKGW